MRLKNSHVLFAFERKLAHLLFNDSRIASIVAWRQQTLSDDFGEHPFVENTSLRRFGNLELVDFPSHNANGIREAEPFRVDPLLQGGLMHKEPNDVMGQKDAVHLLNYPCGFFATQRPMVVHALVRVHFIDHELNFPPLMVFGGQNPGRRLLGIQQRRDQAMPFAISFSCRIVNRIFNDTDADPLALFHSVVWRFIEFGDETAIREVFQRLQNGGRRYAA